MWKKRLKAYSCLIIRRLATDNVTNKPLNVSREINQPWRTQIWGQINDQITISLTSLWSIFGTNALQIYLRFLEYEMQNSNECKRNFVAVYDGSSSVEHMKNKFCSTVANDVMLITSVGVIRMWADEGSRKSRFRILFTTFREREPVRCQFFISLTTALCTLKYKQKNIAITWDLVHWHQPSVCPTAPCEEETFFCHSNMCINHTLVCNGIQNCVYPWDENGCKGILQT